MSRLIQGSSLAVDPKRFWKKCMNSCWIWSSSMILVPCSVQIKPILFLACLFFKCAWKNFKLESPCVIQVALDFCLNTCSLIQSHFWRLAMIDFSCWIYTGSNRLSLNAPCTCWNYHFSYCSVCSREDIYWFWDLALAPIFLSFCHIEYIAYPWIVWPQVSFTKFWKSFLCNKIFSNLKGLLVIYTRTSVLTVIGEWSEHPGCLNIASRALYFINHVSLPSIQLIFLYILSAASLLLDQV